ncbi:hypothetical protein [Cellulomonas denverensis]|uniref:hypothetical protein n=1 Tax=Cellulomonas denverensis TaxID=264297 RepID=UPI0035F0575E
MSATARICSTTASTASCSTFSSCAMAMSADGIAIVWTLPGRTARRAMPIARISMTSWVTAPAARREQPDRCCDHRDQRQAHTHQDRLQGDALGPAGDEDRIGEGIEPVDCQDDVGGLR